ncbi:MAG: lytic murein transglycosylase [Alphaproteobacteria bacterium]
MTHHLHKKIFFGSMIAIAMIFANINISFAINHTKTSISQPKNSFTIFLQSIAAIARKEGISQATIDTHLFSLKRPLATAIAKDRSQSEFILSFRTYLRRTATLQRIARAKQYAIKYNNLLLAAEKKYQVPPEIILAFWALESTFGDNMGKSPVILSLATLAYEGRRRKFFTNELIAALKIIDDNHFQPSSKTDFVSSWAGAMGQVQFMPSTYLRYAVDGDGDGIRDLWHNPADIIFSTANFLSKLGWDKKKSWGQIITLPNNFPYHHIHDKNYRSFHYWRGLGVKDRRGNAIGDHFFHKASIIIPMSAKGPVFLVENNFAIIKKWNNSNFFALSIGLLSDYIAGRLTDPLVINNNIPDWQTSDILTIQKNLQRLHYLDKDQPIDGVLGPISRRAIQQYQNQHGMIADGYPSKELFTILNNDVKFQP